MSNKLRELYKIFYVLKRERGTPATFYKVNKGVTNYETGAKSVTYDNYRVARVVFLPYQDATKFSYPLSFITGNKNFTYGAFFDQDKRTAIVDKKDIPVIITPEFRVKKGDKEYEVTDVTMVEENIGFLLTLNAVANTPKSAIGGLFDQEGNQMYDQNGNPMYNELGE